MKISRQANYVHNPRNVDLTFLSMPIFNDFAKYDHSTYENTQKDV